LQYPPDKLFLHLDLLACTRKQDEDTTVEIMNNNSDNPCLSCSTDQHCCSQLSGLFLAEDEFNRLFKQYRQDLSVRRSGRIVRVSANNGNCPYWQKEGCRIYQERPIDCRIFPYTPMHVIERKGSIKIVFHDRSNCPQKEKLFLCMPKSEIRALLVELGKKMYGEAKTITVQHEKGILSRLINRIEAAISRRRFKV
jgi:Fe-S-cluster containining protein